VLLDLRAPPGRPPHRSAGQAFEWGLSAAASLVEELVRAGRACDVTVLGGERADFPGIGVRAPATDFLEHLALARPQAYAPAPETTLSWLAAAGGEVFWIVASGFQATLERACLGSRVQVLEWVA
jgi:hypothetical protein